MRTGLLSDNESAITFSPWSSNAIASDWVSSANYFWPWDCHCLQTMGLEFDCFLTTKSQLISAHGTLAQLFRIMRLERDCFLTMRAWVLFYSEITLRPWDSRSIAFWPCERECNCFSDFENARDFYSWDSRSIAFRPWLPDWFLSAIGSQPVRWAWLLPDNENVIAFWPRERNCFLIMRLELDCFLNIWEWFPSDHESGIYFWPWTSSSITFYPGEL